MTSPEPCGYCTSGETALLIFSRPFFRGYEARFGKEKLVVDSYRGLFPIVAVPPGSHGELVLTYRPQWLILGGALSIFSAAIWLAGAFAAAIAERRERSNTRRAGSVCRS